MKPIESLVESEQLGLIWSINEIEDFRNHINDLPNILIILSMTHNGIPILFRASIGSIGLHSFGSTICDSKVLSFHFMT